MVFVITNYCLCTKQNDCIRYRTSSFDSTDYKELQFMPYSHKTLTGQGLGTILRTNFTLKWQRYHYLKPIPMYWKGTHQVQKMIGRHVFQFLYRYTLGWKLPQNSMWANSSDPGSSRGHVKALSISHCHCFIVFWWTTFYNKALISCALWERGVNFKQQQSSFHVMFPDVDECETSPCQNDGTCVDELDGYTCQCTDQWYGANCTGT